MGAGGHVRERLIIFLRGRARLFIFSRNAVHRSSDRKQQQQKRARTKLWGWERQRGMCGAGYGREKKLLK